MPLKKSITISILVVIGLLFGTLEAFEAEKQTTGLKAKEFFKSDLYISSSNVELKYMLPEMNNQADFREFFSRHGSDFHIYIDPRTGRASNISGHIPLIPGDGLDNRVSSGELSAKLGRSVTVMNADIVKEMIGKFIRENRGVLGIDLRQMGEIHAVAVTPELWQISIPQQFNGIPVRYSRIVATISHGNLVVIGTETWADVAIDPAPVITADAAIDQVLNYVGGKQPVDRYWKQATLEIVPFAPAEFQSGEAFAGPVGMGLGHRLVWTFGIYRDPEPNRWEILVDAKTGELLSFQDTNQYVNQKITGSVYPLTSTEVCPSAEFCGAMQTSYPMPWANTGLMSPNDFTNSAGVFDYTSGAVTTTLNGKYIRVTDTCGALSKSANGTINLGGVNGQHDCTTPGSGGGGNTPASRSAFYELNKITEQARGWLPANTWLQGQLTSNMNINNFCNAYYDYTTVNFYKSGGGCRNTGEIAAVFDHEWGHALDDNDSGGVLSNSSEAYADIAAIYRYQASCVGYGFWWTYATGCPQTPDGTGMNANEAQVGAAHCDTNCSGVRDADWARHNPNTPDTALGFVCNSCSASSGPCGRQVHCAAAPVRQAAWDLVARDLPAPPFNYDSNTAFLIGNRLFYQGSGNVGAWHSCTCGGTSDGCAAANGYMQWLTVDDDNGNLNDGTPHMTAIYAAFNRHGIACNTPSPTNGGCSGGPTSAPIVNATPGDSQIALSWNSVTGASRYWVLRTEGYGGCNYGKVNLTPSGIAGTSYTDTQLMNGRSYYYNVVAVGSSSSCFGPTSTCAQAAPVSSCTLPDPPTNLTPADGSTSIGSAPVLDWTDVSGALSYDVDVATDATFNNIVRSANVVNSTWTVTPELNYSTTYYWRVRTVNSCDAGSYGTPFSFSTIAPPPGTASYDSVLKAPRCSTVNPFCDSYISLNGRDGIGPEPNQPNTINNSCTDGISGTYHVDESNDRIKVSTLDGTDLAEGKTVKVEATVWADGTYYSSDKLDIYHTGNANSPSWFLVTTLTPTAPGGQTLSTNFALPSGSLQAIRARFRYGGSAQPCYASSWDDHDDLIFAVAAGCGAPPPASLLSPANGSSNQSLTPLLDWSDVTGATSYEVQIATDVNFVNVVRSQTGLSTSSWSVSPQLNPSTLYYWRARAVNSCGNSFWSSSFYFYTAAVPVADFSISCPASLSVPKGKTGGGICTITSMTGFNSPVSLSCSGLPAKVSCGYSPNPVTPPANGSISSTLNISVATSAKIGTYYLYAVGTSGTITRNYLIYLYITKK